MMRTRAIGGFTLIELMVVVAIIGILASIAVPAFVRNARKAKTSEAQVHVRKIFGASRTYIIEEHYDISGSMIRAQFPNSVAATPAGTCCAGPGNKCLDPAGTWSDQSWQVLHFSLDDPHYFRYEYESTGAGTAGVASKFTARALGDLNCDGRLSTFEMVGDWSNIDHDVHGSGGFYQNNALE